MPKVNKRFYIFKHSHLKVIGIILLLLFALLLLWHGKATTVSLYSMMIIHLIWYNIPGVISGILIGACTALALLSAFMYTRENVKKLLIGRKENAEN